MVAVMNEHLGIYEELKARTDLFARTQSDAVKRRILGMGPTPAGAWAETIHPFRKCVRWKTPHVRDPFWLHDRPGVRRRKVYPERHLGLKPAEIVQAVALFSGLTIDELVNESRHKRLAIPRHVAMWLVDRYCPQYSLHQIGTMFERDHTTVMHGINAVDIRLDRGERQTTILVRQCASRLRKIAGRA
jgi:hypothetical protein